MQEVTGKGVYLLTSPGKKIIKVTLQEGMRHEEYTCRRTCTRKHGKYAGGSQRQLDGGHGKTRRTTIRQVECIEAIRAATDEGYSITCKETIKYPWRYRYKNGVEDLKRQGYLTNLLRREMWIICYPHLPTIYSQVRYARWLEDNNAVRTGETVDGISAIFIRPKQAQFDLPAKVENTHAILVRRSCLP